MNITASGWGVTDLICLQMLAIMFLQSLVTELGGWDSKLEDPSVKRSAREGRQSDI